MAARSTGEGGFAVPAELTSRIIWLRAAAVLSMFGLLVVGRVVVGLPIPLPAVAAVIGAALLYDAALACVAHRVHDRTTPGADRIRAWVLYIGGFLDIGALACLVLLTGGLVSPWLYFFVAGNVGAGAVLPAAPARLLTAANTTAALAVVAWSVVVGAPVALPLLDPQIAASPAFAAVVAVSLIGLMGLTANAVNIPVAEARAAARFQERLAEIAVTVQGAHGGVQEVLDAVCHHAHAWFAVDRTAILLLEGEALVVRAAEGAQVATLRGRRIPMQAERALEVEVLRRRGGFYTNQLQRSPYAAYTSLGETGEHAVLLVPLVGSLGAFGVLSLSRRRAGGFTSTTLQRAGILAVQAGVAVENAHLLNRVREEADSVTALLTASERLTRSDDLRTLLTDLNRIAAETARCDRSTTFLWDEPREVFYFGSTFGNPAPFADAIRQLEFSRGAHPLIAKVLAGEPFVLDAAQALAQLPPTMQLGFRIGASAIVPLCTERALQGVMTVSYLDPAREFTADQLWTLRGIARHAALAIERARLTTEEREATATAEALVAFGRELSASVDRHQAVTRIPEIAATAAGCDFAVLALWDGQTHQARILGVHGFAADATEQLLQLSMDTSESPFARLALDQGYIEIDSPEPLRAWHPGLMQAFPCSSLLCCVFGPVEERMGSLTVGYRTRTGPFSTAQKRLVSGIGQQAGVVLENTRLIDDLREANRLKSDFLSTVSHELRTPLNAIIGYADLLQERTLGPLLPDQLDAAQVIAKKGAQLLELINTTLDLTRLEAGQVRVQISEFELPELLAEIAHELGDEANPRVQFSWAVAPDVPPLRTDRGKLKTVVKNLTHNALKFTLEGRVEVRATATAPADLEIAVHDTGIGIAPENRRAIFEMFRQLEPALTRHFSGVGLGLYIVQRLLEFLGGTIRVDSELQRGSVFTVAIPAVLVTSAVRRASLPPGEFPRKNAQQQS